MKKTTTDLGDEHWWFWCPGCDTHHMFRTKLGPNRTGPVWEKVKDELTFKPSLLLRVRSPISGKMMIKCYLYLKKGKVKYLNDCDHHLKGQTISVEDEKF